MNQLNAVVLSPGGVIKFAYIKMTLFNFHIKKVLFFNSLSDIPEKIGIEVSERDQ